jgi:hypothetical protein
MLHENVRTCDVCEEEILKGETYKVVAVLREMVPLFVSMTVSDPDLMPNWTQREDGSVRLDVCLDCALNMGSHADAASTAQA